MRLVPRPTATSFYESFSDLVFCTLVLFILLVLAMTMQARALSAARFVENTFIGASGETRVFIAFVPIEGETHVAWIPSAEAMRLFFIRDEQHDALLELVRAQVRGEIRTMPAEQFVGLASGVSPEFAGSFVTIAEAGALVHLVRTARERQPEIADDPEAIREAIVGEARALTATTVAGSYVDDFRVWTAWAQGDGGGVHARQRETVTPLVTAAGAPSQGDGAEVRFGTIGSGRVTVGGAEFDADMLRAVLAAVSPGRGFRLRYEPGDDEPASVPSWVIEGALEPAGFDLPLPERADSGTDEAESREAGR